MAAAMTPGLSKAVSPIKHLVLSGGGHLGLIEAGVLSFLSERGFYSRSQLQTIHATSVGAIIGAVIALDIPWNHVKAYIVERPWDKVFSFNIEKLLTIWNQQSLFPDECFIKIMEPLLKSQGLSSTATLTEVFGFSGIHLNFYAVDVPSIELVRLSHDTYPDMKLVDAIRATCAIPILFSPLIYNGQIFADGGFSNNYPLRECVSFREAQREKGGAAAELSPEDTTDILGITFEPEPSLSPDGETHRRLIDPDTHTMPVFLYSLLRGILEKNRRHTRSPISIQYQIVLPNNESTLESLTDFLYNKTARSALLTIGENIAEESLDRWS